MRTFTIALAVTVLVVACADPSTSPGEQVDDSAAIYAAALHELVVSDNTFGGEGNPFTELLIQANVEGAEAGESRPLTGAERTAIETVLGPLAPLRWIDDPEEWQTDELMPVVEGSAILGVGPIAFDDDGALVPMSMWCGGLCGTWFDYRLAQVDGVWEVLGIEGPIAVS